jgi:hypothetical protein
MGLIKQICISGAIYRQHGLEDHPVLSRMLLHEYGFSAAFMIDDLLEWSRDLSEKYRLRRSEKPNCWEVQKCSALMDRSSGKKCLCPALTMKTLDGVHEGLHGGRACWVVDGTFCMGRLQGSHVEKREECGSCGFQDKVRETEGKGFIGQDSLLDILNEEVSPEEYRSDDTS